MKAMIFAAGLGTRLRPLTNDRPKALVEIDGMSLLEIQLRKLKAFGVEQVVVNIYHFAELMEERVKVLRKRLGIEIVVSDERELLLETGGGLKKAAKLLIGNFSPILLVNVDIISNLNYDLLLSHHLESKSLATLALRQRQTSRYLVWDNRLQLRGWVHQGTGKVRGMLNSYEEIAVNGWQILAFSGIQIISPEMVPLIRQEGMFSIIDTFLDLASTERIRGYRHDDDLWLDVGKPETLARAVGMIKQILP